GCSGPLRAEWFVPRDGNPPRWRSCWPNIGRRAKSPARAPWNHKRGRSCESSAWLRPPAEPHDEVSKPMVERGVEAVAGKISLEDGGREDLLVGPIARAI